MRAVLGFIGGLLVLAGCQCGPGVACKSDNDCGNWGHCSAATGFCVTNGSGGSGGGVGGGAGGGSQDAGAPEAVLSATSVDLGDAGCGTSVQQHFQVINNGTADLTFTTSLDNTVDFQVSMGGTVAAGMMGTVTVSATPKSNRDANTPITGTVTVLTNDPNKPRFDLPLSYSTYGVTLGLEPSQASFGVRPVSSTGTQTMLLKNTGNIGATVTVQQPADPQFDVDAGTVSVAASSETGVDVSFTPANTTGASSFATLIVAEPVCGTSVSRIDMSGQGTNGKVGLSTSDVNFGTNGFVDCGTQATSQTFTLSNFGTASYGWTAVLGKGGASPFHANMTSGTVPANNSVMITVTTDAIPQQASTAMDAFGDTFTITTDAAGDSAHVVSLHQTAQGASLSFNPGSIDFGQVPAASSANAPFSVVNSGNARVNVSLASDNAAFAVSPTGPSGLSPGNLSVLGTFTPDGSVDPQSASISVTTDGGVLCSPLPPALIMTGTGTMGSVSYSPVALDFGLVDCGQTANPKTIIFSNAGNQAYTVSASLMGGASSPYTFTMTPDSGVVASDGGTLSITVTPSAIPYPSQVTPNLYGDTLAVSTDVTGDLPHDIDLRETAHGSIFSVSQQQVPFGSVPVGVTGSAQFSVTNSGNAAGGLTFALSAGSAFSLPASAAVGANGSKQVTAQFSPTAMMGYSDNATLGVTAQTVLCEPLPFPPTMAMSLVGTGSGASVVTLSAPSLDFGLVHCGATAMQQTITVTNGSSQSLAMSYPLGRGASSPYTVSGPATIAAGMMGVVTVTPKMIPTASATTADGYADSLTITGLGGPVNESHTVALHQTAQGAILSFTPTSLSINANNNSSASKSFTVNNDGNLNATYTLSVGGTDAADFSVSPTTTSVSGGSSTQETATYHRALLELGTNTGNISISTGAALCAPLPGAISLTGT